MAKKPKSTEEQWKEFLRFAKEKRFEWAGNSYLILHAQFYREIVSLLIEEEFLKLMGNLHRCCLEIGMSRDTRRAHPIAGNYSGLTGTYKILQPLETFDWECFLQEEPKEPKESSRVVVVSTLYGTFGPFPNKETAEDILRRMGYQVGGDYWIKGADDFVYLKPLQKPSLFTAKAELAAVDT